VKRLQLLAWIGIIAGVISLSILDFIMKLQPTPEENKGETEYVEQWSQ
jgi:uncharacterized membrane protein YagU involved in acid resistance